MGATYWINWVFAIIIGVTVSVGSNLWLGQAAFWAYMGISLPLISIHEGKR